ncbi:hypothetical protein E2562_017939 [Oryza meyeriana var. granulata]|uniref:Uncharacterized protein n=1 Tax=Oryza meyeriana var. granulata TaxID=110450 RepID=A0A6G1CR53_9ORYZ|nr:hypothetical protein E2562_017939 [Oryza meyeriana var. granulata]
MQIGGPEPEPTGVLVSPAGRDAGVYDAAARQRSAQCTSETCPWLIAKEPTLAEALVETAQARVGPPSAAAVGIDGQIQPTTPALSTASREETTAEVEVRIVRGRRSLP